MTTVYLLISHDINTDDESVDGIFGSYEQAEEFLNRYCKKFKCNNISDVKKWVMKDGYRYIEIKSATRDINGSIAI